MRFLMTASFVALLLTTASWLLHSAENPVSAQTGPPLQADFPPSRISSVFHEGESSLARLLIEFNQPVADFGRGTPSVRVTGGDLARVSRDSGASGGPSETRFILHVRPMGDMPIRIRLVPDSPCDLGGICTDDGQTLAYVPVTHIIQGSVRVSFEGPSQHTITSSAALSLTVSIEPAPIHALVLPLRVTHTGGVTPEAAAGIPDQMAFQPGQARGNLRVALEPGGLRGHEGVLTVSLGELPRGLRAGENSAVEITFYQRELLRTELVVGADRQSLGYDALGGEATGELRAAEFAWRGRDHTITSVLLYGSQSPGEGLLGIELLPGLRDDMDCLYIQIGDALFSLTSGYVDGRQFFWHTTGLDWREGDVLEVRVWRLPPALAVRFQDGRANNPLVTHWGMAGTPLTRLSPALYEDRISAPRDWLPGARLISNMAQNQTSPVPNSRMASDYLWQWGQFLDHDISHTPAGNPEESLNIRVPAGDAVFGPTGTTLPFARSEFLPGTGTDPQNPRQQVNRLTAFIDASQVYGSDVLRAHYIRAHDGTGMLATSAGGRFLLYNTFALDNDGGSRRRDLFLAGDVRANEQLGLAALHTLFVREHNRLAVELAERHPWMSGDAIYETARKIVGAQMQVITYGEFLLLLLGPDAIGPYDGYDPTINPSVSNEFSTAAFRVGHTMLPGELLRVERDGRVTSVRLLEAFFNPSLIETHGISGILRGLARQQAQEVDLLVTSEVRNLLFRRGSDRGTDLAALNTQRGRDHGIADYNSVRKAYGLPVADSFADVSSDEDAQEALEGLYGEIGDLELWVGGLAEDHAEGALVGETFSAIIADQFIRLRDGDRFWYENDPFFLTRPELLAELRETTLADVIRRNVREAGGLPDMVFRVSN